LVLPHGADPGSALPEDGAVTRKRTDPGAFTLIEVLVVVAMIALLIAILVPSLSRAREQAKITVCKTSLQQIGNTVHTYQAAEQDFVPVLFNWYADYSFKYPDGSLRRSPARVQWASVGLRRYDKMVSRFPPDYDPEQHWDNAKRDQYARSIMGKHWICPFYRDRPEVTQQISGTILVQGQGTPQNYTIEEWVGYRECYMPWLWEDVVKNRPVRGGQETHPNDPTDGRPKYSVLTFNRVKIPASSGLPNVPGAMEIKKDATDNPYALLNAHRSWTDVDAKRRFSTSLSEMTILFCGQGNFLAFDRHIDNPGSHRTSNGAGTNTVFADGHVEWVGGTHIGWP
jgi:prepilin-type processing-associated H-X9-DG protein